MDLYMQCTAVGLVLRFYLEVLQREQSRAPQRVNRRDVSVTMVVYRLATLFHLTYIIRLPSPPHHSSLPPPQSINKSHLISKEPQPSTENLQP
jgi:hypothetical protein